MNLKHLADYFERICQKSKLIQHTIEKPRFVRMGIEELKATSNRIEMREMIAVMTYATTDFFKSKSLLWARDEVYLFFLQSVDKQDNTAKFEVTAKARRFAEHFISFVRQDFENGNGLLFQCVGHHPHEFDLNQISFVPTDEPYFNNSFGGYLKMTIGDPVDYELKPDEWYE